MQQLVKTKQERLKRLIDHLRSINPQNLLKNGYAILFTENDSLISTAGQIQSKQTIKALLHDGKITATVEAIDYDTRNTLV
jgi:exonuclease VII large subunit